MDLSVLQKQLDQITDQIQHVTLGLTQHTEILTSITGVSPGHTPRKKGRSSIGTPTRTPSKQAPHPLELVETDDLEHIKPSGHAHIRVVMGRKNACAPLPLPPNDDEKQRVANGISELATYPTDSDPLPTPPNQPLADQGVISKGFADYLRVSLSRSAMTRYTWDWLASFEDPYNQAALQFFLRTFKQALAAIEYGVPLGGPVDDLDLKLTAFFYVHIQTLTAQYKAEIKKPGVLMARRDAGRVRKAKKDRCIEYADYLSNTHTDQRVVDIFLDYHVMGEEITMTEAGATHRQILIPTWWSEKMLEFVMELERRVQISILAKNTRGPRRVLRRFVTSAESTMENSNVLKGLPEDCYSKAAFLNCLIPAQRLAWKVKPPILSDFIKNVFLCGNNPKQYRIPSQRTSQSETCIRQPCTSQPTTSGNKLYSHLEDESEFPEGIFDRFDQDGDDARMKNLEEETEIL